MKITFTYQKARLASLHISFDSVTDRENFIAVCDEKSNGDEISLQLSKEHSTDIEVFPAFENETLYLYLPLILGSLTAARVDHEFKQLEKLIASFEEHRDRLQQSIDIVSSRKCRFLDELPLFRSIYNDFITYQNGFISSVNTAYLHLDDNASFLTAEEKAIFSNYLWHQQEEYTRLYNAIPKTLETINTETARLNANQLDNALNYIIKALVSTTESSLEHLLDPTKRVRRYILNQSCPFLPNTIKRVVVYDNKYFVIEITYKDGSKAFFGDSPTFYEEITADECRKIFIEYGAILDNSYSSLKEKILPEEWSNLKAYDAETWDLYKKIHAALTAELIECIKSETRPIEIVFIGCGQGDEMAGILAHLKNSNCPYVLYGIERDKNNVLTAQSKFSASDHVMFLNADAKEIDQHIKTLRMMSARPTPIKTIAVACGSLTRCVLDPQTAFEIFQKTASFADVIFVTGKTETLIKRRDAKRCGTSITQKKWDIFKDSVITLDRYDYVPLKEQVANLQDCLLFQPEGKKHLSLSGHARPAALIKALLVEAPALFQGPIEINLREAFLNEEDQCFINDLVKSSQGKISITTQAPLIVQGLFKPGERPKLSDNFAHRVQQELESLKLSL